MDALSLVPGGFQCRRRLKKCEKEEQLPFQQRPLPTIPSAQHYPTDGYDEARADPVVDDHGPSHDIPSPSPGRMARYLRLARGAFTRATTCEPLPSHHSGDDAADSGLRSREDDHVAIDKAHLRISCDCGVVCVVAHVGSVVKGW
eukprot:6477749-Amphidinium_carterae.1